MHEAVRGGDQPLPRHVAAEGPGALAVLDQGLYAAQDPVVDAAGALGGEFALRGQQDVRRPADDPGRPGPVHRGVAASLLCGLAGDAATLLAGRSLQGLGAALMSPAALAAVMTLFTGASRGKALPALAGAGSALGGVPGGILGSEAGWRWVFTVNVPIGVALLTAIPLAVPARPPSQAAGRGLDVPGAMLDAHGYSALHVGLAFLPVAVATITGAQAGTRCRPGSAPGSSRSPAWPWRPPDTPSRPAGPSPRRW